MRRPSTIPLNLRLPNSPLAFTGRADEVKALRRLIERAPVSLVWGVEGLGKTALVLHTLHTHFAAQVSRTLLIRAQPGRGPHDLMIEVIRAISQVEGLHDVDWGLAMQERDFSLAAAIDLADEGGWWVLFEDLHHMPDDDASAVLTQLARYARVSRWLATSRSATAASLQGQVLALEPLPETELRAMARRLEPRAKEARLDAIVPRSHGSPWTLRRLLVEDEAADLPGILDGLRPAERDLIEALALVERRLPWSALHAALAPPGDLEHLERRGLLECGDAGVRLHPTARPFVTDGLTATRRSALERRLAEGLADVEEPTALLEALRLQLRLGLVSLVEATLKRHLSALLRDGFAPELWRLLEPLEVEAPTLFHLRLRCAVESGAARPETLSACTLDPILSAATRLLAARGLYDRNLFPEAEQALGQIAVEAQRAGDGASHIQAQILRAQALTILGRSSEVPPLCESLGELTDPDAFFRDQALAAALIQLGEFTQARPLLDDLHARLPGLPSPRRPQAAYTLIRLFYTTHRLNDAVATLEETRARLGRGTLNLTFGRKLTFVEATLAMEMGRLEEARRLFERLEGLLDHAPLWLLMLRNATLWLTWHAAPTAELAEEARALALEARRLGHEPMLLSAESFAVERAVAYGQPPMEEPPAELPGEPWRLQLALERRHHHIRHGRLDPDLLDRDQAAVLTRLQAQARINAALYDVLTDHPERAIHTVVGALDQARAQGYHLLAMELLKVAADVALLTHHDALLTDTLDQLKDAAQTMPAPRAARLRRFLLASTRCEPAALERSAADLTGAPIAARRARALLGGGSPLDALDRAVLDAIRRRQGWQAIATLLASPSTGWTAGWGLDLSRRHVWTADHDTTIDLSAHKRLWSFLTYLVDCGGCAHKEALILNVWGERLYNPALHDNRLRLAVRKLRKRIEADPSSPQRLLRVEDGYALGGPLRVLGAPGDISVSP